MSAEEFNAPGPIIPNGFYHLRYGSNPGVGGLYLTAGAPGTQASIEALRPQPGRTQTVGLLFWLTTLHHLLTQPSQFRITFNPVTGKYILNTNGRSGVSYNKPVAHSPVITSHATPREFQIALVNFPDGRPIRAYRSVIFSPLSDLLCRIRLGQDWR